MHADKKLNTYFISITIIIDQLVCTEYITHLKREPRLEEFMDTFNSLNRDQNAIICASSNILESCHT